MPKIVFHSPNLDRAIKKMLNTNDSYDLTNQKTDSFELQKLDSEQQIFPEVSRVYNGNFHLVDGTFQRPDGTFMQRVFICGRNVDWQKIAEHKITGVSDPNYFYVNGEKKEYPVYANILPEPLNILKKDIKYYVYFYYYMEEVNEIYPEPLFFERMDVSPDEAKKYLEDKGTKVSVEPTNIILIGSVKFNSDGSTEVEQIFDDSDGIADIYLKGAGKYNGPFAVSRINDTLYKVQAAPEFMGGDTGYAGSICAPDMQILSHIPSWEVSYSAGQENTLLVLKAIWTENGIRDREFLFVPDPWKNPSDATKMLAIDYVNPKTTEHPYRNPFISIYPIARIDNGKIVQIQQGHIVEYNRWWRS